MGLLLSRILSLIQSKKPCKIFMIGLDGAGKTTVLYRLKLGEVVVTIPTIGFNLETVEYKNISFNVWDVGGGEKLRPLYRHYAADADAFVYVVDSTDLARLAEAKDELIRMINMDEVAGCPLLVLANKRDLPHAAPLATITESLGLHSLEREWHIQPTCATTSEGLYEGLDWLAGKLS